MDVDPRCTPAALSMGQHAQRVKTCRNDGGQGAPCPWRSWFARVPGASTECSLPPPLRISLRYCCVTAFVTAAQCQRQLCMLLGLLCIRVCT